MEDLSVNAGDDEFSKLSVNASPTDVNFNCFVIMFTWVATTDVVSTERLKVLLGLDTAVTNVCSTSLASGISAGVMVLLNTTSTSASVSDARVLVPARLNAMTITRLKSKPYRAL